MRLLLDTHTLLWFLQDSGELPASARAAIEEAGAGAYVSFASLWEIAIKVSIGKLKLPGEFNDLFPYSLLDAGLSLLALETRHLNEVLSLPHHHRDPFDRLLIAQAQSEKLTLVSCDPAFSAYAVPVLW